MDENKIINETKVFATARTLVRVYYDLMNHFGLNTRHYKLNLAALSDLTERYWLDVDRLHRYHNTERIDRHKIAGYLTYWICKLRPIAVVEKNADLENASIALYINELFSVFVAFGRLEAGRETANSSRQPVSIKKGLLNALLYNLRYRPVSGDMMAMTYYLIEEKKT
jgi:hypothetical protein